MSSQCKTIRTPADVQIFLDETNGLHDGYITHVAYHNNGITPRNHYLSFDCRSTSLILHIMVTSLPGLPTFEILFQGVTQWQIRDFQMSEITDCTILFPEEGKLLWADDCPLEIAELKKGSYVIADGIQYRKL